MFIGSEAASVVAGGPGAIEKTKGWGAGQGRAMVGNVYMYVCIHPVGYRKRRAGSQKESGLIGLAIDLSLSLSLSPFLFVSSSHSVSVSITLPLRLSLSFSILLAKPAVPH